MRPVKKTIAVINQLKAEGIIPQYALGGATAALFYTEPASTEDIDVFILLNQQENSALVSIDPIIARLKEMGYTEWIGPHLVVEGWPIQFIPARSELEHEAINSAIERQIESDLSTFVPSPEHLIAIALSINRPKDRLRVLKFYNEKAYDPTKLEMLLEKYELKRPWQVAIGDDTLAK